MISVRTYAQPITCSQRLRRARQLVPRLAYSAKDPLTLTLAEEQAQAVFQSKFAMLNQEELISAAVGTLKDAAVRKVVKPEVVEGALAHLAKAAGEGHHSLAPSVEQVLDADYRLVFSTATKLRALQYIPVKEDFVFNAQENTLKLESWLGPLHFLVKGRFETTGAHSIEFAFETLVVDIFGQTISDRSISASPKSYTYFLASDGVVAARSSAGGLTMGVDKCKLKKAVWKWDFLATKL